MTPSSTIRIRICFRSAMLHKAEAQMYLTEGKFDEARDMNALMTRSIKG